MKTATITDCLKRPTLEGAIITASELGLDGVQIYATTGIFSPEVLTSNSKLRYKKMLCEYGLEVSALCADTGGYGFEKEETNAQRVKQTKAIIDLAAEFGARAVTTHIGVIPSNKNNERYSVMLKALTECGLYAKERGVTVAIETGPEKASVLKAFLDDTKGGVGVNLDPANFTMITGQDAAEAVYELKDYIVHTHVKDGVKLDPDLIPEQIYHAFAAGGQECADACRKFEEKPIGEGNVDWKKYIAALKEIGYNGFLTLEREAGDTPLEDIKKGISFIRNLL